MRLVLALIVVLTFGVSAQAQYITAVPAQGSCADGKCYAPANFSQQFRQQHLYPQHYHQPYYVVPKQAVVSLTFEVYKIEDGKWGWELKLGSDSLSKSTQVYKTKAAAQEVAKELFGTARTVVVQERAAKAAQEAVDSAVKGIENKLKK